jgi:hypothetical protein
VAIGLVLAFAYHILSMSLQRWVAHRNSAMVPVVTILGFLGRLAVLAATLVVLGLWTPLNILALCLTFVVVFSVLTGFSLYKVMAKRPDVPPSVDAGGVQ